MSGEAAQGEWLSIRRALSVNAAFSAISAAVAILASGDLAGQFGIDDYLLAWVGFALFGFAVSLTWLSGKPSPPGPLVRCVVALDVAWVAGTVVVVARFSDSITTAGEVLLVAIAAVVGLLAFWQHRCLGATSKSPRR